MISYFHKINASSAEAASSSLLFVRQWKSFMTVPCWEHPEFSAPYFSEPELSDSPELPDFPDDKPRVPFCSISSSSAFGAPTSSDSCSASGTSASCSVSSGSRSLWFRQFLDSWSRSRTVQLGCLACHLLHAGFWTFLEGSSLCAVLFLCFSSEMIIVWTFCASLIL